MKILYRKKAKHSIIHVSFEIGLIIKGIDGLLEIIGGFLLLFLNPERLSKVLLILTQHELSEDPKDIFFNSLIKLSQGFSVQTQYFGVFYLLSHGVIKAFLIFLLWRRKLWAYPVSIAFLIIFVAYQTYRFSMSFSMTMVILTVFDLIMIILTIFEYKRIKLNFNSKPKVE